MTNQMKTCELTQEEYGELMACLNEVYDKLDKLRNTILNITGKFNDAHFIEVYLKVCLDESGQESQCAQDLLTLLNSLKVMLENPPDDVLAYFDEAVTNIDAAMVLTANIMGSLRRK